MRLGAIVIDSDNAEDLSDFYSKLLGWTKNIQIQNGEKWITVVKEDYTEIPIIIQENNDYIKPKWPSCVDKQQQMLHLDFYVSTDEFEIKIEHAIKCGAKKAENQFSDSWEVMLDPSGHPFCIIPIQKEIYKQRYN